MRKRKKRRCPLTWESDSARGNISAYLNLFLSAPYPNKLEIIGFTFLMKMILLTMEPVRRQKLNERTNTENSSYLLLFLQLHATQLNYEHIWDYAGGSNVDSSFQSCSFPSIWISWAHFSFSWWENIIDQYGKAFCNLQAFLGEKCFQGWILFQHITWQPNKHSNGWPMQENYMIRWRWTTSSVVLAAP